MSVGGVDLAGAEVAGVGDGVFDAVGVDGLAGAGSLNAARARLISSPWAGPQENRPRQSPSGSWDMCR